MITPKQAKQILKIVLENKYVPFILFTMSEDGIQSVSNVCHDLRNEFIKDLFVNLLGRNPDSTTPIQSQ